ncbi:MAG: 2Fe-2S iron-sulfur cluster binding domain-containing protein [Planctomycetes bacterium]|nr:2Fe-2S iron-sulfur cluster binding domain-containing protein [Planctomycetota bacterium]
MGGINPYNQSTEPVLPTQPFQVTFEPMGTSIQVDPAALPYTDDGLPGSILDIALGHGIELDHACGGVCACSTCHVIVEQGLDSCQEASEDEEDMLDTAPGLELKSRLACQAVPNGEENLVVRIPSWNRNHAKEVPH